MNRLFIHSFIYSFEETGPTAPWRRFALETRRATTRASTDDVFDRFVPAQTRKTTRRCRYRT